MPKKGYPRYPGRRLRSSEFEGVVVVPRWSSASYGDLWNLGNRISGGFGFWRSSELFNHPHPEVMVKAWFDALREKGYSPEDAVLYGDWSDGRHIADNLTPTTTYAEFKAMVKRNARSVEEVHKENASYRENPEVKREIEIYLGPYHTEEYTDFQRRAMMSE
ncbi:MAG TPA: hypothetical protein VGG32_10580 [Thermoplasmata archaeon]|jgi:hypothetical protein